MERGAAAQEELRVERDRAKLRPARVEPRLWASRSHQGLGPEVLDQGEVYEGANAADESGWEVTTKGTSCAGAWWYESS